MTVNPFVPSGYEDMPNAPLEAVDHARWYVGSVGGHEARFADFCAALDHAARRYLASRTTPVHDPTEVEVVDATLRALRRAGRLVVVEGPERSGKTTFINRCVAELRKRCTTPMQLSLIDARRNFVQPGQQLPSAHELRVQVCEYVLEMIEDLDVATRAEASAKLGNGLNGPLLAYLRVRQRLNADRVLVVLLPPAPADIDVDNLMTYHQWMGQGMIFFAERTTTPNSLALGHDQPPPEAAPTLILRLESLAPGEAYTVVRARLGPRPPVGLPDVSEETLREVEGLNRSDQNTIGWVIGVFRELFQRRIEGLTPPKFVGLPSIPYDEITDLIARRENGEQS